MNDLLQRSILLTIGAAALTLDMTESLASDMIRRGQETTDESRKAVDEFMERARDEVRNFRGSMDSSLQSTLRDIGIPSGEKIMEMELKIAQLEHRLSLLENGKSAAGGDEAGTANPEGEGSTGEPGEES